MQLTKVPPSGAKYEELIPVCVGSWKERRLWVLGEARRKPLDLPTEQSGPIQLGSQLQRPVSGRYVPCPLHWSGHWTLASSQLRPPQPGLQRHSPFTQTPWLEQVGSKQSTEKKQRGKVLITHGGGDMKHQSRAEWTSGSPIPIHLQENAAAPVILMGPLKKTHTE